MLSDDNASRIRPRYSEFDLKFDVDRDFGKGRTWKRVEFEQYFPQLKDLSADDFVTYLLLPLRTWIKKRGAYTRYPRIHKKENLRILTDEECVPLCDRTGVNVRERMSENLCFLENVDKTKLRNAASVAVYQMIMLREEGFEIAMRRQQKSWALRRQLYKD